MIKISDFVAVRLSSVRFCGDSSSPHSVSRVLLGRKQMVFENLISRIFSRHSDDPVDNTGKASF